MRPFMRCICTFQVRWIAAQINKKFKGQKIVLTGILKGVFIFMSDLCKHLTIPYTYVSSVEFAQLLCQNEKKLIVTKFEMSKEKIAVAGRPMIQPPNVTGRVNFLEASSYVGRKQSEQVSEMD